MMTTDWLLFRARTAPDNIAIITAQNERRYTYKEINHVATVCASYFLSIGFKKGDRIVIIAYNCIEYIYLFGAAQKLGLVLVPLNYRLTKNELKALIEEIDPSLILFDDANKYPVEYDSTRLSLTSFFESVNLHKTEYFNPPEIHLDDELFILYTSGSSGLPKGVLYTHKMLFWNSINTMLSVQLNASTTTIVCMPPFHTGGWNVLLTPLIHLGGTSILMHKFEADKVLGLLEKYSCSIFMGVPTMLKMIAALPNFQSANLELLNYIIVGGETMPIALIEAYHQKNIYIRQGYGMTEAGPNLTSLHEKNAIRKIGSIGKPNMYVKVRLVTPEGEEVIQGERGELQIKGPMTMKGYFNKEKETLKALKNGWLATGDIAVTDEEGFIYIVDRIKNMFISGGENVYPAEVERVIQAHPSVLEVIVVGEPSEKWGETGKAIISLQGDKFLSLSELQSFCSDKLSKYKIPKSFIILDELPKNDAGKLDRKKLSDTLL